MEGGCSRAAAAASDCAAENTGQNMPAMARMTNRIGRDMRTSAPTRRSDGKKTPRIVLDAGEGLKFTIAGKTRRRTRGAGTRYACEAVSAWPWVKPPTLYPAWVTAWVSSLTVTAD